MLPTMGRVLNHFSTGPTLIHKQKKIETNCASPPLPLSNNNSSMKLPLKLTYPNLPLALSSLTSQFIHRDISILDIGSGLYSQQVTPQYLLNSSLPLHPSAPFPYFQFLQESLTLVSHQNLPPYPFKDHFTHVSSFPSYSLNCLHFNTPQWEFASHAIPWQ